MSCARGPSSFVYCGTGLIPQCPALSPAAALLCPFSLRVRVPYFLLPLRAFCVVFYVSKFFIFRPHLYFHCISTFSCHYHYHCRSLHLIYYVLLIISMMLRDDGVHSASRRGLVLYLFILYIFVHNKCGGCYPGATVL